MMILAYPVLFLLELLFSALAVLLSPVLALLARTADSNAYCYAPGPREFLPGVLQLASTHDDAVDAGWYQKLYDDRAPAGWPQKARDGSRLYRWMLRVWWIVRNSGYGFAHFILGFDRTEGYTTKILAQRGTWDTDTTNWLVRVDTTTSGRKAFQIRAQIYFTKVRYLRVNLGWKLTWTESRVQIATHINPFRKWQNK